MFVAFMLRIVALGFYCVEIASKIKLQIILDWIKSFEIEIRKEKEKIRNPIGPFSFLLPSLTHEAAQLDHACHIFPLILTILHSILKCYLEDKDEYFRWYSLIVSF
jgi:hypothetical protein